MIKKSGEMQVEVKKNMRDGKGEVRIQHLFDQKDMKAATRLAATLTIEKNSSIGLHTHEKEEEIYYIVQGTGLVTEADVRTEVLPGDAVLTGDGGSHAIENIGNEPLILVAVINLYH